MDISVLTQVGLSELQAKIYLYLVENGQRTPAEIAKDIDENRTTVYSALERLVTLGVISQNDRGKIAAYTANHPSTLESLAEKRLRSASKQVRNLESNLPVLTSFYREHQRELGTVTSYGQEGLEVIREKIVSTGEPLFFLRSHHDEIADKKGLEEHKKARVAAGIKAENITPSEFTNYSNDDAKKWNLERTFLPPNEYDSPVEIDIFGENVAFINYSETGISTLLIESPEIADAMKQFFLFSKKYIRKAEKMQDFEAKDSVVAEV